MDREQILSLYEWQPGTCFRHPGKGEVPTAVVETIRPTAGGVQEVRACEPCVVEMAKERQSRASRPRKVDP